MSYREKHRFPLHVWSVTDVTITKAASYAKQRNSQLGNNDAVPFLDFVFVTGQC